jgi:hypothetical protein
MSIKSTQLQYLFTTIDIELGLSYYDDSVFLNCVVTSGISPNGYTAMPLDLRNDTFSKPSMMVGFSPNFVGLSLLIIILPLLHSQLSPVSGLCNSRDQDLWVWGFVSNPALCWSQSKELKSLCPHDWVIKCPLHPFWYTYYSKNILFKIKYGNTTTPKRELAMYCWY